MAFSGQTLKDTPEVAKAITCFHCGQVCDDQKFQSEEKSFCCYGCKTVYEILNENNLCEYYDYQQSPGVRLEENLESFHYLDEPSVRKKLVQFEIEGLARVQFYVPAIHCISCLWLLENLNRLNPAILKSEVNFARKTVAIDFKSDSISLSGLASLITSTGYKPLINLEDKTGEKVNYQSNRRLLIQLAVAGFCFGNIMLLSFPEYLGIDRLDAQLQKVFSYLNIALSLPVILFSASDYFKSALKSLYQKQVNIDVPIAIGIFVLFIRSVSDIMSQSGPGYMDSLAGLVFFLLIGRWFQDKTYESLAFDRDYKSYFPLAVYKKEGDDWKACVVQHLQQGDQIKIRNQEIIPADSFLISNEAFVDYGFVTGESKPIRIKAGELVYAGGKIIGQPAVLTVNKETSQSHLTSLWNNDIFKKPEYRNYSSLMDRVAQVFTWSVLGLALVTGLFWYGKDSASVWLTITSVLMVACPCALALAAPFTYGSMLRVFGNHGLYLKNANVIEDMAKVDAIVFDKTGTITLGSHQVTWNGRITKDELHQVKAVAMCSTHPLSVLIAKTIKEPNHISPNNFKEIPGKGIEGKINNQVIKLGSAEFVGLENSFAGLGKSRVYVSIDGQHQGFFEVGTSVRPGIKELLHQLGNQVKALLSGDGQAEKERMQQLFGNTLLKFDQSPQDKLDFVRRLQDNGNSVMMIGDGLNDSGALRQSNVGIAVADDSGIFTPASDGILSGSSFAMLDKFLRLSKIALIILKVSLGLSLLYNVVGLSFAVTGHLTPLVAAILMPVSSISVVVFTTFMVRMMALRILP